MNFYEVWDSRTGNLLGSFATEDEALALVRAVAPSPEVEIAEFLGLSWGDEDDEALGGLIVDGVALVRQAWAGARPDGRADAVPAVLPGAARPNRHQPEAAAVAVRLDKRDGIAWITLNRPAKLNALDSEAKHTLAAIWREVAADPMVSVAVVAGAGTAFCAGSDLKEMQATGRAVTTEELAASLPGVAVPLDKPVLASIHGYCIGMGLTLALHCDLRLAANDAVFGFPEVQHGTISGLSALALPQVIPSAWAMELLLLGERCPADEAYRMGLVNRVLTREQLWSETERWATRLRDNSPVAVQATKRLAAFGLAQLRAAGLAEVAANRDAVEHSADFREGVGAFVERRPPSFPRRPPPPPNAGG